MKRSLIALTASAVLLLSACDEDPNSPYLEFSGGGFIFNYRIGEAYYGLVAKPLRDIPMGTTIVAEFEDPAGGPPLKISRAAKPDMILYSFRTPGVKQVKKERPYLVTMRLINDKSGEIFAEYSQKYTSSIDQDVLPDNPLTIGPGYHPYQGKQ